MVLLTMTPAIVAAVEEFQKLQGDAKPSSSPEDPPISQPNTGNPISHGQIMDISRVLLLRSQRQKDQKKASYHLADLLRGSQVYIPPKKPKAEPTSEYKELMARLRKEEQARAYATMTTPAPQPSNPFQKFTAPNSAAAWDVQSANEEADEVKFNEINQQLALIINVLVSIIACSIAVWLIARNWSVPARLTMSMLCSLVVGVAEVAIYAGYIRKLGEAKAKERSKAEIKTITDTWVIDGTTAKEEPKRIISKPGEDSLSSGARRRKGR